MKLKIEFVDSDAALVYKGQLRKDEADAGFDLRSRESDIIWPGEWKIIRLGIKSSFDHNHYVQIACRSGLAAKHAIQVLNTPGTIDSGYRGEWKAILYNHGKTAFQVSVGDRVCQAIVRQCVPTEVEYGSVNEDESTRGSKGFGSSGVK